jgi:predicted RecB family endonuclease
MEQLEVPPSLPPLSTEVLVDLYEATRDIVEKAVWTAVDVLQHRENAEIAHETVAVLLNRARVQIAGELLHEAVVDDPARVLPYAWRMIAPSFQVDQLEFSPVSAATIARMLREDHNGGAPAERATDAS